MRYTTILLSIAALHNTIEAYAQTWAVPQQSRLRGTAAPERSYELEGEQWLEAASDELVESMSQVAGAIVDVLNRPVIIMGSYPAKYIADLMRSRDRYATPNLVANDIDVFYEYEEPAGENTETTFEAVYSSLNEQKIHGEKVNSMGIKGLTWEQMLTNNDIDCTGVLLTARRGPYGELIAEIHASKEFWKFMLSIDHEITPMMNQARDVKTTIRLAYKAFQMGLPFDARPLPVTGLIRKSHIQKIREMEGWPQSPFRNTFMEERHRDDGKVEAAVIERR